MRVCPQLLLVVQCGAVLLSVWSDRVVGSNGAWLHVEGVVMRGMPWLVGVFVDWLR